MFMKNDQTVKLQQQAIENHVLTTVLHPKACEIISDALQDWCITVKDNIDVEGEVTLSGSLVCQSDAPKKEDAPLVKSLRQAGASIVGKTNMTEFAFSGVGINPHYGTPINLCDTTTQRIPGGSSSGAAVSVAMGLARAAIGTDTGGSIRIPSALCGLVGYKGTQSKISRQGVTELSRSLDSIGVIARTVEDAWRVNSVLSQTTFEVSPIDLKRVRLACPQTLFFDDIEPHVHNIFLRAIDQLIEQGVDVEFIDFQCVSEIGPRNLPGGFSPIESFAAHQKRIESSKHQMDPRVVARMELGRGISAADYLQIIDRRAEWIGLAQRELAGFDALVCPTVPIVAPALAPLINDDDEFFRINRLLLRNPSVINYMDGCSWSLPIHYENELPVGLMLSAFANQDEKLASIVKAISPLICRI
jgi:aspartyl-tRNA(Asn)/glutamyl-tRNA(Gln) amidotransferase subunit A